MKILLAVDGSEHSKKMLQYVAEQAPIFAKPGADGAAPAYTLLHVHPNLPMRIASAMDKDALVSYYAEESDKVMVPLLEYLASKGIQAEARSSTGQVAEVIAQVANMEQFQMLIMGTKGHGSLMTLVLGSCTNEVLARCKIPVLLVP